MSRGPLELLKSEFVESDNHVWNSISLVHLQCYEAKHAATVSTNTPTLALCQVVQRLLDGDDQGPVPGATFEERRLRVLETLGDTPDKRQRTLFDAIVGSDARLNFARPCTDAMKRELGENIPYTVMVKKVLTRRTGGTVRTYVGRWMSNGTVDKNGHKPRPDDADDSDGSSKRRRTDGDILDHMRTMNKRMMRLELIVQKERTQRENAERTLMSYAQALQLVSDIATQSQQSLTFLRANVPLWIGCVHFDAKKYTDAEVAKLRE
jgi:hypothetical protein